MGFIDEAADKAYRATMDRVASKLDYGYEDPRPALDTKQQREFLEEASQGKNDEPYRQALEHHGFKWYPLEKLALMPGTTLKTEGEWRNDRLKLAYTPRDLTTGFPQGPEQFDRYLREEKMRLQVSKGRVSKADFRKRIARK